MTPLPSHARRRPWTRPLLALAGYTLLSLFVATQNYLALANTEYPISLGRMFALELPVWYSWWLLTPAVFYLADRFPPERRPWIGHLLIHLAAGLVAVTISLILVTAVRELFELQARPPGMTFAMLVGLSVQRVFAMFLVVYFALVAVQRALAWADAARDRSLQAARLEALLAGAQLDALRAQLHPHFLFNTLHAISGLMGQDVPAARRMMTRLSELLRIALEPDAPQEVSLREEIRFLEQYAEIQRTRFQGRLTIDVAPDADALDHLVPRLALQPLVENAIRHGTARRAAAGRVELRATADGERLRIVVRDDGPGPPPDAERRDGVGLGNTRARLEQLYGADHRFELRARAEGGAEVVLEIPAYTTRP